MKPTLLSNVFASPSLPLRKPLSCSLALLTCTLPLSSPAQTTPPPDAGQIQRQLEQSLPTRPAQPPSPSVINQSTPDRSQARILLRQVSIEGATLIPEAELIRPFAPYLGQSVGIDSLHDTAQSLVALYRERGWFARVTLPPQDLTEGILRIQITEARFGSVMRTPQVTRAHTDFVARMVGHRLQAGQPYSMDDLERGLLLANDLPGIQADGVLQAGSAPGTSDLALTVRDQPWVSGQAYLGNQGSRLTGQAQATAQVAINNLSGDGDQLRVTAVAADQLAYGMLNYSTPLGTDGLRLDLGYSQLHYKLGKEFATLDAEGRSDIWQAGLSYPLQRSAARNLWLALNLARRNSRDDVLGSVLRERKVDTSTLSVYGDSRDPGNTGTHAWRLDLTHGNAHLQRSDDRDTDASAARVAGSFTKLNANLNRDQWLAPAWYLRTRATAQWAPDNLESSQQFVLGGAYGVRGYPANEGIGDSGVLLQMEAHRLLGDIGLTGLDAYAFIDGGLIRQHHTLWSGWSTADSQRNSYALYAGGLGLRWHHASGVMLDAVLARPIGRNPVAVDGNNQDGSQRGTRLWLNASYAF